LPAVAAKHKNIPKYKPAFKNFVSLDFNEMIKKELK